MDKCPYAETCIMYEGQCSAETYKTCPLNNERINPSPPSDPGWYWLKLCAEDYDNAGKWEIMQFNGEYFTDYFGNSFYIAEINAEIHGPIPEPREE